MTFAISRELVGAGAAVSDEEVAAAVAFAFRELKLVVEPGGAAALAALMSGKIDVKGKIAVAVLSGGNVDPDLFYRLAGWMAHPPTPQSRGEYWFPDPGPRGGRRGRSPAGTGRPGRGQCPRSARPRSH